MVECVVILVHGQENYKVIVQARNGAAAAVVSSTRDSNRTVMGVAILLAPLTALAPIMNDVMMTSLSLVTQCLTMYTNVGDFLGQILH